MTKKATVLAKCGLSALATLQKIGSILKVLIYRAISDDCFMRASSLTYSSLLSLVPLLAVMFGVAKGFGIEKILEQSILQEMREQREIVSHLIGFGYRLLEEMQSGVVAGFGVIFLFITILLLLSNIENSLNHMWGQKQGRTLVRKICDYLTLVLIGPIAIVISSSLTLFITGIIHDIPTTSIWIAGVSPLIQKLISLIPYVMSFLLFAFLYMFIPNAQVRLKSACIAAIFAGISYQFLQATYITIQIQLGTIGTVYGSFAALPLFLIWIYTSWMIFLIGAEIVVIHQERLWEYSFLPNRSLSQCEKQILCLAITRVSQEAFLQECTPATIQTLSKTLRLPERLVSELVEELVECKILVHTLGTTEQESGFLPASSPDRLHICDVIDIIQGKCDIVIKNRAALLVHLEKTVKELLITQHSSEKNIFLKDVTVTY